MGMLIRRMGVIVIRSLSASSVLGSGMGRIEALLYHLRFGGRPLEDQKADRNKKQISLVGPRTRSLRTLVGAGRPEVDFSAILPPEARLLPSP